MFWNRKDDASKSNMTKILHIRTLNWLNLCTKVWEGLFLVYFTYVVKEKWKKKKKPDSWLHRRLIWIFWLYFNLISDTLRMLIRTFCLKLCTIATNKWNRTKLVFAIWNPILIKLWLPEWKPDRSHCHMFCIHQPIYSLQISTTEMGMLWKERTEILSISRIWLSLGSQPSLVWHYPVVRLVDTY